MHNLSLWYIFHLYFYEIFHIVYVITAWRLLHELKGKITKTVEDKLSEIKNDKKKGERPKLVCISCLILWSEMRNDTRVLTCR